MEHSPQSSSTSSSKSFPSLRTLATILVGLLILFGNPSIQIAFAPKLITRFCYNSPNLSTVNSQCVLCNYYMFDATVLGCTGSTALTMNITSTQAFCVISQCLGQIRQAPVFLGRRKRDSESHKDVGDMETEELDNDNEQQSSDLSLTKNMTIRNQYKIANEIQADVYADEQQEED